MTYKVLELGAHLHTSVAPAVDGDNFRSTFNGRFTLRKWFLVPIGEFATRASKQAGKRCRASEKSGLIIIQSMRVV